MLEQLHRLQKESRLESIAVAATVRALVESLVAAGVLPPHEYERRRERAQASLIAAEADLRQPELSTARDKYALTDLPVIDCADRMPLCHARCCTLRVCLSQQDLDEGVLAWDFERPYRIRRREDSYCAYSEPESHRCIVYAHRPAICRTYDCRRDERIWIDFDKRIPAE